MARDLRALADDAETRSIHYAKFDALRVRLYVLGYELSPKLVDKVATTIRDAKGPAKPLKHGWLKRL